MAIIFCMKFMVFFLTLLSLLSKAGAEVIEDVDFQYYQISPRSPGQVTSEINKASGSVLWAGFTRWKITRWYGFEEADGRCSPQGAKVYLAIRYKMPKLFPAYSDPAIKRTFDRYYRSLLEHEEGHGNVARMAALEVDRMLAQTSAENCLALKRLESEKFQEIIREHRLLDKRYDIITNHGRNQDRFHRGMFEKDSNITSP